VSGMPWHVISEADFMAALVRVRDGEDPEDVYLDLWESAQRESYVNVPDPPEDALDLLEQQASPTTIPTLHEVIGIQRAGLEKLMFDILESEAKPRDEATVSRLVDELLSRPLTADIHETIGPPKRRLLGR
jgi:hypothetical protein